MKATTPRTRGRRYWRNLFLAALAGSLVGCLLLVYVAFPILHAQGTAHPERAPVCCTTPADWGLDYEKVSFKADDGVLLRGWYVPAQNGAAIILAHGIAGNRLALSGQATALAQHGYGLLLLDLRAHGESGGETVSFGGKDVSAATGFLQSRDNVDPKRIGALGVSLGGLVVLQAAARTEAIRAVVADGPGPGMFRDTPPPGNLSDLLWVPFDWVWFKTLEHKNVTAPVSLMEVLPQVAPRPIMLISATGKRYERRALQRYYAAAAEPKSLWEIPEASHAGGWAVRPGEYADRIVTFFDQALLGEQSEP